MKIKIKKSDIPIIMWAIGLFVFPYIFREKFLGVYALINLISYFGLFYGYQRNVITFPFSTKEGGMVLFWRIAYIILGVILIIFVRGNGWNILRKISLFFVYLFPAAFIGLKFKDRLKILSYCSIWRTWLRVVCTIMCCSKLIDLVIGNVIQRSFASFYESGTMLALVQSGRFVSYYGHSLNTTYMALALLVWATVLESIKDGKKERKYLYDVIISLFCVAISGSKAGIALAVFLILLCNVGIKRMKYMFFVIFGFGTLYLSGVFDLVIERILEGLAVGDLTTSRNTALIRLIGNGTISFDLLHGHVINYEGTSMVAALEYPILRWAFTSGIVFAVLMTITYFIVPFIKMIKSKNLIAIISVLIFMAFVNTNNGISAYNDDLMFYAINVGLIIQCVSAKKV